MPFPAYYGTIDVTASAGCGWTAESQVDWININSGAAGTGNGIVGFTVFYNVDSTGRTGTIIVAGKSFTLSQTPNTCVFDFSFTQQTYSASGGAGILNVTTGSQCWWSIRSNDDWIMIDSPCTSGVFGKSCQETGSGQATFTVALNDSGVIGFRYGSIDVMDNDIHIAQSYLDYYTLADAIRIVKAVSGIYTEQMISDKTGDDKIDIQEILFVLQRISGRR